MKQKPHIIQYRGYKKFSNEAFINDLKNTCFNLTLVGKTVPLKNSKKKLFTSPLKKHTPLKKEIA